MPHPHTLKTQAQRGTWLAPHGSVEIGCLQQNRIVANMLHLADQLAKAVSKHYQFHSVPSCCNRFTGR